MRLRWSPPSPFSPLSVEALLLYCPFSTWALWPSFCATTSVINGHLVPQRLAKVGINKVTRMKILRRTKKNQNMKLITHNMLQSNVKGVQKGYPLGIKATKLNVLDVPFNKEFVKSMLSRLDYAVLRMAARAVCQLDQDLPKADPLPSLVTKTCQKKSQATLQTMKNFWRKSITPWTTYAKTTHTTSFTCDSPCSHFFSFQLEIEEGSLVCQESGREFPIKNGIPDMLLKENEVK